MDKHEFWATKSPLPQYEAITFEHPAFSAPIRLVANQFAEVTLGGDVYTPAPMQVKPPDQSSGQRPRLTVAFPRAVVGREFRRQLRSVAESGMLAPITVLYALYLGAVDVPEITWPLYVSDPTGVVMGADVVQVTATDDNPMRRNAAIVYDPSVWTGLELL